MFAELKGTELEDERLATSVALFFNPAMPGGEQKLYDRMKEIRDLAYSMGYKNGREDEKKWQ